VILNAGYEDSASVDQPGVAAVWTVSITALLEATAGFAGDMALADSGYETFEHGWGSLDPQALQVGMIDLVELEPLASDTERFERGYADDQGFFVLISLATYPFDASTQTSEDFEDGWGVVDADKVLSPSELSAAVFDAETFEDFEEQWGTTLFTLSSVTTAVFDNGGLSASAASPSNAEKFLLKLRQRVKSNTAADTMYAVTPPLSVVVGDAVTFIAEEGALPVPLDEDVTYIVQTIVSDAATLAPHPGATIVNLTADGLGANYLLADPGRFWLEEL
jgi:hypothetical protein